LFGSWRPNAAARWFQLEFEFQLQFIFKHNVKFKFKLKFKLEFKLEFQFKCRSVALYRRRNAIGC